MDVLLDVGDRLPLYEYNDVCYKEDGLALHADDFLAGTKYNNKQIWMKGKAF